MTREKKNLARKARAVGLDLERAERAHHGTSFVPEKRAAGAVGEVRGMIARTTRNLRKTAKSPAQKAAAKSEISRYKRTLADKYNAVLDAKSRTMSSMIAGPSNFPARRNQKRVDTEMKRTNELLDWDKKAQKSMQKAVAGSASPEMKNAAEWGKLKSDINRNMATVLGIDKKAEGFRGYDRSSFTTSIQAKIKRLAASGQTDLVNKALQHIKDSQASLKKPIFTDRNSIWSLGTVAEKSTVAKAAQAAAVKANPESRASVQFKGVDIVENRAADRLQLRFPDKPDASVRSELKSRGFRWSPKEGAWQRQLTDNARSSAVGALEKVGFGRADAGLSPPSNKQELNQRLKDVEGMRAKVKSEMNLTGSAAKRARVVREAMGSDAKAVPIDTRKSSENAVRSMNKTRQLVSDAARVGKGAKSISERMNSLQAAEQEIAKSRTAMSDMRKSFREEVKGFKSDAKASTAGQRAYEADLKQRPNYHDGMSRKPWNKLGDVERQSWERNPTARTAPKKVDASGQDVVKQKQPQTKTAKPATVKAMRAEAKAAGIKGYSKLNKAALADALKGNGPAGWSDEARQASAKVRSADAKAAAVALRRIKKELTKEKAKAQAQAQIVPDAEKRFAAASERSKKAQQKLADHREKRRVGSNPQTEPGEAVKAPKKVKLSERQKLQAKHQRIAVTAANKGMVSANQKAQQDWANEKLRANPKSPSFSAEAYQKLTKGKVYTAADINTQQFAEGRKVKLPSGQVLNSTWYTPPTKSGGQAMEPLAAREQKYANWIKQGKPKNYFGVGLTVGAPFAAALMAYDATRSSAMAAGKGKTANASALKAAAVAGGTTAGIGLTIGAAIKYGMRASATIAKVGARALPLALPAMAVYGAYQGYQKDGLRGAALGAIDVPTFGLASYAASKLSDGGKSNKRAKAEIAFRARRGARKEATSTGRVAAHTRRSGTRLIHIDSRAMTSKEVRARSGR